MKSARPTILFVREVPWESVFPISTRMIAEQFFLNGWNVIWITNPLMPWHWNGNGGPYREQLLRQNSERGLSYNDGRVFAYTPRSWLPFSKRFPLDRPSLSRLTWQFCLPSIKSVIEEAGMPEPDVLWLSSFLSQGMSAIYPGKPVVQHVTDYYQDFSSAPATCGSIEKYNYEHSDHVVVTAPSLRRILESEFDVPGEKISLVSHGVNNGPYRDAKDKPDPLPGVEHPRLVMLGNLGHLDLKIVEHICENLEKGTLLALGPPTDEINKLASLYGNLKLTGPVRPENVPLYLAHADIGLIIFREEMGKVAEHVNPMKLYEYAAAGLPVVSTTLPIYKEIEVDLLLGDTPEEFWNQIDQALEKMSGLGRTMLKFAEDNSWKNRYSEAVDAIIKAGVKLDQGTTH